MPNHNQVKLSAVDPLVLCQLNASCGFSMSTACGEIVCKFPGLWANVLLFTKPTNAHWLYQRTAGCGFSMSTCE